jgi:hypothetical protein
MKNTVENALRSSNLKYQVLKDSLEQKVIKLGIELENGRCDTFIDVRTEPNQILIFTTLPTNVPQNQRTRIAEFISRANYGLIIGNFELDFNDGQLRYKASYNYDDTFPNSETVFLTNLYATFNMMDRYLPGIMSVIYANILPQDAISQIEKVTNPTFN